MTPKHEATMGMESQPIDHETEAFKVLQVIEQRAWALGDEQYARLAKEAMDHLSLATTQPAEQRRAAIMREVKAYAASDDVGSAWWINALTSRLMGI